MQTDDDMMASNAPKPLRKFDVPEGFADWMPDKLRFKLLLERANGQWYATAESFNISGVGPSEHAAVRDVLDLVNAYLLAHYEDGVSFEETLRPVSLSTGVKIEAKLGTVLHGLLRGAADRIPVPREKRVDLPLPVRC